MAKYKSGEEAMVGDVVRCVRDNSTNLIFGREYNVVAYDQMGLLSLSGEAHNYSDDRFTLIRRAAPPDAERPSDQQLIAAKFDALKELCLAKNSDYGSTFARPPCLATRIKASDAVLVRMSDKIGRLQNLLSSKLLADKLSVVDESIADTVSDLSVYGILYLLAREKEASE